VSGHVVVCDVDERDIPRLRNAGSFIHHVSPPPDAAEPSPSFEQPLALPPAVARCVLEPVGCTYSIFLQIGADSVRG
jgi:hypothetical protein